MAFDPVRDAILNSPERTEYADPFGDEDEGEQGLGQYQYQDHDGVGVQEEHDHAGDFKAPAGRMTSNSESQSPERPSSSSANFLDVAQTPGGYAFPPTPGGSISSSYDPVLGTPASGRPPLLGHRQSSIFSLLSPDMPTDGSEEPQNGYFEGGFRVQEEPQELANPTAPVASTSSSASVPLPQTTKQRLKPSLVVKTAQKNPPSPAAPAVVLEPVKRGRPYAPGKRLNGPPPPSLRVPLSQEEREYYLNPVNCKNPLRTGIKVAARSPLPVDVEDLKGKGRDMEGPPLPDDIDYAPRYRDPSPLDPSLQPGLVVLNASSGHGASMDGSNGSLNKKRKRSEVQTTAEYTAVAAHYNKRQNFSREERTNSPIIGLKSFNNWVKSVLIAKYARDHHNPAPNGQANGRQRRELLKVLDLGCGKGGDLQKWQKAGLREYIGVDIADVSVQQARSRWEQLRPPRFEAAFYALDAFSNPLSTIVPQQILTERLFDVVSMQFCMHYAFQSVEKARMMLENVSRHLRKGGTFLGTIPDSENLLSRLREVPDDAPTLTFGNDVYSITFDDRSQFPEFGHRYTFFLQDAVEDVPEYVVQWDSFETLALEYSLKPLYHATFHELFEAERENPEFAKLLERMRVVNAEGESELTEEQWEAANIYVAYAFEKI